MNHILTHELMFPNIEGIWDQLFFREIRFFVARMDFALDSAYIGLQLFS